MRKPTLLGPTRDRLFASLTALPLLSLFLLLSGCAGDDRASADSSTPSTDSDPSDETSAGPTSATSTMTTGAPSHPLVTLETNLGTIVLELDAELAPITTENFLVYVDNGFYDGEDGDGATIFHRVVKGFVVQGGGLTEYLTKKPTMPPIANEASNGLSNIRGSVAMARTQNPDSATSQFFINVVDNPLLDEPPGYTVFGQVLEGIEVVDTINEVTVDDQKAVEIEPVGLLQPAVGGLGCELEAVLAGWLVRRGLDFEAEHSLLSGADQGLLDNRQTGLAGPTVDKLPSGDHVRLQTRPKGQLGDLIIGVVILPRDIASVAKPYPPLIGLAAGLERQIARLFDVIGGRELESTPLIARSDLRIARVPRQIGEADRLAERGIGDQARPELDRAGPGVKVQMDAVDVPGTPDLADRLACLDEGALGERDRSSLKVAIGRIEDRLADIVFQGDKVAYIAAAQRGGVAALVDLRDTVGGVGDRVAQLHDSAVFDRDHLMAHGQAEIDATIEILKV